MVLLEAAVESLARARQAVRDGAQRLELCARLDVGGLTPAVDLVRAVRGAVDVPLHVLIRPRPGHFVYADDEVALMVAGVLAARAAGADALVVGALEASGAVDTRVMARLREAAAPAPLVAHRCVDQAREVTEAVAVMDALGIARVLTAGGAANAEEGIGRLADLVRRFPAVTILAGGSVRASNVARIVAEAGVREVHVGFPEDAEEGRIAAVADALSRL